jgi:hypothetical protein
MACLSTRCEELTIVAQYSPKKIFFKLFNGGREDAAFMSLVNIPDTSWYAHTTWVDEEMKMNAREEAVQLSQPVKHLHSISAPSQPQPALFCGVCLTMAAEKHCEDCDQFYCRACSKAEHKARAKKYHFIIKVRTSHLPAIERKAHRKLRSEHKKKHRSRSRGGEKDESARACADDRLPEIYSSNSITAPQALLVELDVNGADSSSDVPYELSEGDSDSSGVCCSPQTVVAYGAVTSAESEQQQVKRSSKKKREKRVNRLATVSETDATGDDEQEATREKQRKKKHRHKKKRHQPRPDSEDLTVDAAAGEEVAREGHSEGKRKDKSNTKKHKRRSKSRGKGEKGEERHSDSQLEGSDDQIFTSDEERLR